MMISPDVLRLMHVLNVMYDMPQGQEDAREIRYSLQFGRAGQRVHQVGAGVLKVEFLVLDIASKRPLRGRLEF